MLFQIEKLLSKSRTVPVTNQVECHPYLAQNKLKKFCQNKGISLTAYSPLGNPGSNANNKDDKGCLLKDKVVLELAQKYNKNAGQVLIKFQIQRGVIVLTKSVTEEWIRYNIQVFDLNLTEDEIKRLEALDRNYRSCPFESTAHLRDYPFAKGIEY